MTDEREPAMSAREETWLKEILAESYLDDDGFTDRVLSRLPHRPQRTSRRTLILTLSTVLAGWLGLVVVPGGDRLWGAVAELIGIASRGVPSALPLTPLVLVVAVLVGSVAAAFDQA